MSPNTRVKTLLMVLLMHFSAAHPERKDMDDTDISNDVIRNDVVEVTTPARFSEIMKHISEQNNVPHDDEVHFVPSEIIDKTRRSIISDGYDPYYLNNFQLKVPSKRFKGARFDEVVLDNGKLFGMSDFRSIDDSKLSEDSFQLWLIWNRLRATYTVTINTDGLKDIGEINILAGRLLMHVQMPLSYSKDPKVEVSKVKEFETKISGLDIVSEDSRAAVILQIESEIRNILNSRIRNILLSYMKRSFDDNSFDNKLSPFMLSSEIYEVRFK